MPKLQLLKPRVLVIDDDPFIGSLLRRVFEQTGRYSIAAERNALSALTTARLFRPSLLIVDLSMPDRSGLELAVDFRTEPVLRNCPIILFSGAFVPNLEEFAGTGQAPIEFMRKTTPLPQLIEAVDRLLEVKGKKESGGA